MLPVRPVMAFSEKAAAPPRGSEEKIHWRCRWPSLVFGNMKVADLKEVVEREPFRPFTVRLNNGAQYTFKSPRFLGAAQDYGMIFYFGEPRGAVRIDRDSIVEIIEAD